jgi:hypothetical protein
MKKRRKKLRCCWGFNTHAQCKARASIILVKIDPPKGVRKSKLPLCNEHYIAMAEDLTIGILSRAMRATLKEEEDEKETRH